LASPLSDLSSQPKAHGKIGPVKISRISLALKAWREIGPRKLGLFALYRLGLRTGYFRWATKDQNRATIDNGQLSPGARPLLKIPDPVNLREIIGPAGLSQLKAEADEIVAGRARLFGGPPVPIDLTPAGELVHWSQTHFSGDIKFTWEPARFSWAFTLGHAYHLTGDERYPAAFWRYYEIFQQANPVNLGSNWESGQEVALRLIAFAFAAQIFAPSKHSTADRQSALAQSIADHAARIPPTLIYARAQNNNHLLSEAAGLITASLWLPDHPRAPHWSKLGWKWINRGLQSQIAEDGSYMQQSSNYHRVMLQLALWVDQLRNAEGRKQKFEGETPDLLSPNLQRATRWLLNLCDPESGQVPNLGPNDGAYIMPLTVLPFADYRPVLQAASQAFLGEAAFKPGPWDEMGLWLNSGYRPSTIDHRSSSIDHPPLSIVRSPHSWAYLRAAHFFNRPGHADQLHLDLWWRGLNVAQDAGAYRYNAEPPWDNTLVHTAVHNTVMIDDCQQMVPAGRFLYLDWAQAEVLDSEHAKDGSWERISAQQDGYRKLGVIHQRTVTAFSDDHWLIEDCLLPSSHSSISTPHTARLHWLLPDWKFELLEADCGLQVASPQGSFTLVIRAQIEKSLQLIRAGELLHGRNDFSPTWGWVSPTYGVKQPALSFSVTVEGVLPIVFVTEWRFPEVVDDSR
jgi:hypothetical protein